jgi:hypothetical protein
MKKIGTWMISFIPAVILAYLGFLWAASFHRYDGTGSVSPKLIIALLAVGPIFIISHSAIYAFLAGRQKTLITILSATLLGSTVSTLSVFLIVK